MFRNLTKRKSRYKMNPVQVIMSEPDSESIIELYGNNPPCYDHGTTEYCDQLLHLFASLITSCNQLNIQIPTSKDYITDFDALCRLLTGDHYHGQPSLFYQSMKKNFEHLLFLLKNPAIESERKVHAIEELTPNLLNCGAGLHSHLLVCLSKLMNNVSINNWLADLRRDIIYQIACQQVIRYSISKGSEIHVFNALMRYAQHKGWQPAGAVEIEQIRDVHIANVSAIIRYHEFERDYFAAYQPSVMIDYLATQLAKSVHDLCLQEFIVVNDIIDFHQNDYTIVATRLATFKHFATIDELLDFSDDYRTARIKSEREFRALVANLCIAQQLIGPVKYLRTKTDNTFTIIMSPKPQTVLLDNSMDDDATQFFCQNPLLWPQIHFKFARYLFKKSPMPIAVYQFYRKQGHRNFAKLNLTKIFAEAHLTNNAALIKDLLHVNMDFSILDSHGVRPIIAAAKTGGNWPLLIMIARKYKRITLYEIGFEHALLYAVRDNELAAIKDLIALRVEPLQATIAETHNNIFHVAITYATLEMLTYLLTVAIPVGINKDDLTPIALAATLDKWEMVRTLAMHSTVYLYDYVGMTQVLMIALEKNQTDIILLILSREIPCEKLNRLFTTDEKNYALHLAVIHNNAEVVHALLTAQASIQVRNAQQLTPVQLAASLGHLELIAIFCQFHPIDLNALEPYFTNTHNNKLTLSCTIN